MIFPANLLHNRLSAHFIEINNIYFYEMTKQYVVARKEILAEREASSEQERRTKYISNPNYIYEPFKNDSPAITRMKQDGRF